MIKKEEFGNGIRVIHEHMPHMRSVAIGVWIDVGSVDEEADEAGVAHFIEHMLFKGTSSRTARMIAEEFDQIGGDVNAFTSKEHTCFFTTVLSEHANKALEILEDMIFRSTFDENEIAKEKLVVLEELAAVEDTPDDDVQEYLWAAMYPEDPVGRPILGSERTITAFTKEKIEQFMERCYRPARIVVSVAGNYDRQLIQYIETLFDSRSSNPLPKEQHVELPTYHPNRYKKSKEIEQGHLCLGFPGLPANDERMYDLVILDSIIGGAMSSRLFQEVREERGLAYSIYSYYTAYANVGAFIIYGGTSPEKVTELNEVIHAVIQSILKKGVTPREVENAKQQVIGGFLLGLESTESRMYRNGNNELVHGRHEETDDIVAKIEAVTPVQVHEIAEVIFSHPHAVSLIASAETIDSFQIQSIS